MGIDPAVNIMQLIGFAEGVIGVILLILTIAFVAKYLNW